MRGIIKNSLVILICFWMIYFVFYFIDVKMHTVFITPIVFIIFVLSLLYISKNITLEERKFKKKNHLSNTSYLYYSVIIFLILAFLFIFIFDSICRSTGLVFNIYYNEGATNTFLNFLSTFYYYIKILFPILLVVICLIRRYFYRKKIKK